MPLSVFIAALAGAFITFTLLFLEFGRRGWRTTAEGYLARNQELINIAVAAERTKTRAETDLVYLKRTLGALSEREVVATLNDQQFAALLQAITQYIQAQGDPERMS